MVTHLVCEISPAQDEIDLEAALAYLFVIDLAKMLNTLRD